MWESEILLTDGQVVFPRILRVSRTFDERSARYKWNILEGAINLPPPPHTPPQKKKKKKKKKKNLWELSGTGHRAIFDITLQFGTTKYYFQVKCSSS